MSGNAAAAALCTAGLVASVAIFLLTGATIIRSGYARDAGIYVSAALQGLVWITPGASAVLFLVFCPVNRFAPVRGRVVAGALLAMLLAGSIAANGAWRRAYDARCAAQEQQYTPGALHEEYGIPHVYARGDGRLNRQKKNRPVIKDHRPVFAFFRAAARWRPSALRPRGCRA